MTDHRRTVGLFVTCLVDLFRPGIAEAAAVLIEQAGFDVRVPTQTCCGQVNFNSGDRAGAVELARRLMAAFDDCDYVVAPSSSCIAMIREYPELFGKTSPEYEAAQNLAARSFELSFFLREVARFVSRDARFEATAAYYDSCSALRTLQVRDQPRALLGQVEGLTLRELPGAGECCGFGGLFCMKFSEVSTHIVDQKIDEIVAVKADFVVSADLGCLLHIEGRMQRRRLNIRALHVAEVLAGSAASDHGNVRS